MKKKAEDFILANITRIKKITGLFEDGKMELTFADLEKVVNLASDKDLERFVSSKRHELPFEDGYLAVII